MKVYCKDCKWFGIAKETEHVECKSPENIKLTEDYYSHRKGYRFHAWEINAHNDCIQFTPRLRAWLKYRKREKTE